LNTRIIPCFFLPVALLATPVMAKSSEVSFFHNHARGWHWYEVVPEEPATPEAAEGQETSRPQSPTEWISAYRKELERRLHAAFVNPTPRNIKRYQEMQKDLVDRSKLFSTVWMQSVFQNPALDHTLVSPVNHQGRLLQIDLEKNRTAQTIQNLSQTHGLFFFFAGSCPWCHEFAPIVKRFAHTYGWKVIAISVDGGSVAEFPDAEPDNGLFRAWNVQSLPSLFAVNPNTQKVIPIAHGLTSLDEMERRVMALAGQESEESKNQDNSQLYSEETGK